MANFALIIYGKDSEVNTSWKDFFCNIKEKVFTIFSSPKFGEFVKKINLYENVNAYIIELPYNKRNIYRINKRKLEKFLAEFRSQSNVTSFITPDSISDKIEFGGCTSGHFYKPFLFKCLTYNIIENIYLKRGINVNSLDICIVKGSSNEELYAFIKLFSHVAKYISVLAKDKDSIEDRVREIYAESGLSVAVTSDCKNAFEDVNVIINLGDLKEFDAKTKTNKTLLIFNYGGLDISKISSKSIVINGVDIGLPKEVRSKISKNVYKYFTEQEIAGIILYHMMGEEIIKKSGEIDNNIMRKMYKQFKEGRFTIRRFLGLHGPIREDLIELVYENR